ncbi:MAG: stress-responsive transcription factor hsf1 [Candelina mexicana]|nr:MAG: stress-responsive transcription factor hsf1 [Candelina mexicana]
MQTQTNSRKRAAPGASPIIHHTTQQQPTRQYPNNPGTPQLTDDQFLSWGQTSPNHGLPAYPDPTTSYNPNTYNTLSSGSPAMPQNSINLPQATPTTSNQLTRRPANQYLVARGRLPAGDNNNQWSNAVEGALQQGSGWENNEDDDEMERRALTAKRGAEGKHKNIPPFVQKLSSFLEDDKNFSLIRWSRSGDSFIVVDEDEFAKRLIPELFKHNNYASFVRQLNMYGFHKKVGLSDNSMNASADGKRKTPSEYSHPYFKKHRSNLLWLINKPKNSKDTGGGGKRGDRRTKNDPEDGDLDEERDGDLDRPDIGPSNGQTSHNLPEPNYGGPGAGGDQPLVQLPAGDISNVRQEIQSLRKQQKVISDAINRLRQDHHQLYEQAIAFQTLHDRHESSINAILTFLATVYSRSLDGQGGQNFASMFANAIPQEPQAQGNVVDVGDYSTPDQNALNNHLPRPFARQPLLLKAPPTPGADHQTAAASVPSPAASAQGSQQRHRPHPSSLQARNLQQSLSPNQTQTSNQSGAVEELFDPQRSARSSQSPRIQSLAATPDSNGQIPERDIMTMINRANATKDNNVGARFDFPAALTHIENANGNSPLTPRQRNDVLSLMANTADPSQNGTNNALLSPEPPPMPSLERFGHTAEELDLLARLQAEQGPKIQNLTNMLQPLSPTGSIPGLADGSYYNGQTVENDLDQFFNSSDYFAGQGNGDLDFGGEGVEFDFGNNNDDQGQDGFAVAGGIGTAADGIDEMAGSTVETVGSSAETSPATAGPGDEEEDGSSVKRRRRN